MRLVQEYKLRLLKGFKLVDTVERILLYIVYDFFSDTYIVEELGLFEFHIERLLVLTLAFPFQKDLCRPTLN